MPTKFTGHIAAHPEAEIKKEPIDLEAEDTDALPPLEPIKPYRQNAKMYAEEKPPCCPPPAQEVDVKSIFQIIGASFAVGVIVGYLMLPCAFSRELE